MREEISNGMKVLVISASMRSGAQSLKIARYLTERLKRLNADAWVLDLYDFRLPMYDDEVVPENQEELLAQLQAAEAYVFVSPEWNGMMSYGLMNMLHFVEHEMAYKPVMLVGVSSGRGGTHPVDQMKLIGQKNRHYVISPESLIVSGVKSMFNDSEIDESAADYPLKARAEYSLKVLLKLADALREVRASGVIDLQNFKNGV